MTNDSILIPTQHINGEEWVRLPDVWKILNEASEIKKLNKKDDPDFIKSWELAVQMVAAFNRDQDWPYTMEPLHKDLDYWQEYFYEQLKGGTDGK